MKLKDLISEKVVVDSKIQSENKKKNMKILEDCFTEDMKDEIKKFNK